MPEYKYARARGFAPWSPNDASRQIVRQVHAVLEAEAEYLPLTARQVFYRMVANHGFPKTEKAYARLCDKINRARRSGMIGWDAIRDDGETVEYNGGFYDVRSFAHWMSRRAQSFEIDPKWVQPCRVEVHVEAAGMMPQIAAVACPLGATVYSSGGFGSVTAQYEAAKRMAEASTPTVVLSIGDFDPSGLSLYWAFRENVLSFFADGLDREGMDQWDAEAAGKFVDGSLDPEHDLPLFRRIAVTHAQILEYDFTTAPRKANDARGNWQGGTVQCEAIPSALLAEIVRDAILEHYDEDVIEEVARIAADARPQIIDAYRGIDLSEIAGTVRGELDELRDPGRDWRAGYSNDDELDMEEGV